MRLLKTAFLSAGILMCSLSFFLPAGLAGEPHFDHSAWDQFLKKFVSESGTVNYAAVKADPALLNQYIEQLKNAETGTDRAHWRMKNWPREEQLAFWLNAYHAGIVLRVVQNYPVRSINDISGVWTVPTLQIGQAHFSLNDIRSGELMQAFRDEKIDMVLSCGARSCPPFPREAFAATRVEGQIFMLTNQRVQDESFVRMDLKKKRVYLSRIFHWYGEDFILDFGAEPGTGLKFTPPDMAVLSFIRYYTQDVEKVQFLESLNFKIKYLPFDWKLADWDGTAPKED